MPTKVPILNIPEAKGNTCVRPLISRVKNDTNWKYIGKRHSWEKNLLSITLDVTVAHELMITTILGADDVNSTMEMTKSKSGKGRKKLAVRIFKGPRTDSKQVTIIRCHCALIYRNPVVLFCVKLSFHCFNVTWYVTVKLLVWTWM